MTAVFAPRAAARRALFIMLSGAVLAWVSFIVGTFIDLQTLPSEASYTDEIPVVVSIGRYFTFGAVAFFGLGSLIALRQATALRFSTPSTALARAVELLGATGVIIAAAVSVVFCFVLFVDGFNSPGDDPALARGLNLYLPIVLYTALVLVIILFGFVFAPQKRGVASSDETAAPAEVQPVDSAPGRSNTALAYVVPIVTAALGLLAGLVLSDLTGSASEAWVWALVFAFIAAGVMIGVAVAQAALREPGGSIRATVGARAMGFVVAVVLAATATLTAFAFGASAVWGLSASPYLSVTVVNSPSDPPTISTWGSDLEPGSAVAIDVQGADPSTSQLTVDADGTVSADIELTVDDSTADDTATADNPSAADEGAEITATVSGTGQGDAPLRSNVTFTLPVDGTFEADSVFDDYVEPTPTLLPATGVWFAKDLLPAALIMLIAVTVTGFTVTRRNPENAVLAGPTGSAEPTEPAEPADPAKPAEPAEPTERGDAT